MKTLLLTTDAYGSSGGIALYNRDLAEAIVALGASSTVTVVPRVIRVPIPVVPARVDQVPGAARSKVAWLWESVRRALFHWDLVICGHVNLLPVATLVARFRRVPLVLLVYGIDVWQPHPSAAVRRSLRRVDAVWSISEITRDRFLAWSDFDRSRIRILPNAIHLERYGEAPASSALRARYGINSGKVLLTLARLVGNERYKGIDETLEVLPALLKTNPRLKYIVAGDGNDRGRLEQKARNLGIAEHVVFTGFVPEKEKADLYRLADVFVMPGRGEGFGFVFLEALACGTPAVGSRLDGSREALRAGLLGALVDPDSHDELVAAVLQAMDSPRGVPAGLDYFAWPAFVDRLHEAIKQIVHFKA